MSLFEPFALPRGAGRLRNRLVLAPISRVSAEADGTPTDEMARYYARFAREGVGLVTSEATFVGGPDAKSYRRQPGMATRQHQRGWRQIAEAVAREGGTLFVQLQHGGPLVEPAVTAVPLSPSGMASLGLSWQDARPYEGARPATDVELQEVVDGFASAARLAIAAGCCGVELHGARGYLLDAFLSACTNERPDRWGGSLRGRLELPVQVVRAVRLAVGNAPISYNLSLYKMDRRDYRPPGGRDELETILSSLHEAGADILHLSTRHLFEPVYDGLSLGQIGMRAVPCPIVSGGGVGSLEEAERVLDGGHGHLVAIGRSLVANPDWIARVGAGQSLRSFIRGMEREPTAAPAEPAH